MATETVGRLAAGYQHLLLASRRARHAFSASMAETTFAPEQPLYHSQEQGSLLLMSKITAILEPQPDGSLHLPVPEELRHSKVKVTATLEPVSASAPRPHFGGLAGKIWMVPDFDAPLDDFKDYMR